MEEPPEISEFVQELGGALGQEAGSLGAAAAGGGGLQPPRCVAGQRARMVCGSAGHARRLSNSVCRGGGGRGPLHPCATLCPHAAACC